MCLLEKDESQPCSQGGTHDKYRRWIGNHPNLFRSCSCNAFVVRSSGVAAHLRKHTVLSKITERGHFARKRFGRYEVSDFLAVLFGYAISGERTLEEFYESLQPFAIPFMALFACDRLPSRSALSRFLAALTEAPVEALHMLFLDDLLSRPLPPDKQTGGLVDRQGNCWMVFDIDGTREAARQRALPQGDDLPMAFRRLDGRLSRLATEAASGGSG
jgi:hypothetical protein